MHPRKASKHPLTDLGLMDFQAQCWSIKGHTPCAAFIAACEVPLTASRMLPLGSSIQRQGSLPRAMHRRVLQRCNQILGAVPSQGPGCSANCRTHLIWPQTQTMSP